MYLKDAPKWSRSHGSLFTFVATTQEIQDWILIFSSLDFVVYRQEVDDRGWFLFKAFELENFFTSVMNSPKQPISYLGPRNFIDFVDIPSRYLPGEWAFSTFMSYNGMINLYHSVRRGILKYSHFSVVYKVINDETMSEHIMTDAKNNFFKLKRCANKMLTYNTLTLTPPHPINELIPATPEAIKAHHPESDWLPGPKKEVKPRVRKKKT